VRLDVLAPSPTSYGIVLACTITRLWGVLLLHLLAIKAAKTLVRVAFVKLHVVMHWAISNYKV